MRKLDLNEFCSRHPLHTFISRPWTRGEYTNATDGHILIRVPALAGIDDNPKAPNVAKVMAAWSDDANFVSLSRFLIPEPEEAEAWVPAYDETGDDLPDECRVVELAASVRIAGFLMCARYARQIASLPGAALTATTTDQAFFKFEGGIGSVMGLRAPRLRHIDLAEQPAPTNERG